MKQEEKIQNKNGLNRIGKPFLRGAGEQNRTADLFITNEVHYLCATPACVKHKRYYNKYYDFCQ